MTDQELLAKATAFDGGLLPTDGLFIFEDDDDVNVLGRNIAVQYTGFGWCISQSNFRLNKRHRDWEYSPINSERTDEFKRDTTFETPQAAFEFLEDWKKEVREQAADNPNLIRWKDRKLGLSAGSSTSVQEPDSA